MNADSGMRRARKCARKSSRTKSDVQLHGTMLKYTTQPAAAESAASSASAIEDLATETRLFRLEKGFKYTDQKNAVMCCPENNEHRTELFRSQPPTSRLYWRCLDCKSTNAKYPHKLIGADAELEPDGFKTVDASRTPESSDPAKPRPIVSGHGLRWDELFETSRRCLLLLERIERKWDIYYAKRGRSPHDSRSDDERDVKRVSQTRESVDKPEQ